MGYHFGCSRQLGRPKSAPKGQQRMSASVDTLIEFLGNALPRAEAQSLLDGTNGDIEAAVAAYFSSRTIGHAGPSRQSHDSNPSLATLRSILGSVPDGQLRELLRLSGGSVEIAVDMYLNDPSTGRNSAGAGGAGDSGPGPGGSTAAGAGTSRAVPQPQEDELGASREAARARQGSAAAGGAAGNGGGLPPQPGRRRPRQMRWSAIVSGLADDGGAPAPEAGGAGAAGSGAAAAPGGGGLQTGGSGAAASAAAGADAAQPEAAGSSQAARNSAGIPAVEAGGSRDTRLPPRAPRAPGPGPGALAASGQPQAGAGAGAVAAARPQQQPSSKQGQQPSSQQEQQLGPQPSGTAGPAVAAAVAATSSEAAAARAPSGGAASAGAASAGTPLAGAADAGAAAAAGGAGAGAAIPQPQAAAAPRPLLDGNLIATLKRTQGPYPVAPLLPLPQHRRPDGSLFLSDQDEVPDRTPPLQPLASFQWPMLLGQVTAPLEFDSRKLECSYGKKIELAPEEQKEVLLLALRLMKQGKLMYGQPEQLCTNIEKIGILYWRVETVAPVQIPPSAPGGGAQQLPGGKRFALYVEGVRFLRAAAKQLPGIASLQQALQPSPHSNAPSCARLGTTAVGSKVDRLFSSPHDSAASLNEGPGTSVLTNVSILGSPLEAGKCVPLRVDVAPPVGLHPRKAPAQHCRVMKPARVISGGSGSASDSDGGDAAGGGGEAASDSDQESDADDGAGGGKQIVGRKRARSGAGRGDRQGSRGKGKGTGGSKRPGVAGSGSKGAGEENDQQGEGEDEEESMGSPRPRKRIKLRVGKAGRGAGGATSPGARARGRAAAGGAGAGASAAGGSAAGPARSKHQVPSDGRLFVSLEFYITEQTLQTTDFSDDCYQRHRRAPRKGVGKGGQYNRAGAEHLTNVVHILLEYGSGLYIGPDCDGAINTMDVALPGGTGRGAGASASAGPPAGAATGRRSRAGSVGVSANGAAGASGSGAGGGGGGGGGYVDDEDGGEGVRDLDSLLDSIRPPSNLPQAVVPPAVVAHPKPFQLQGLEWMLRRERRGDAIGRSLLLLHPAWMQVVLGSSGLVLQVHRVAPYFVTADFLPAPVGGTCGGFLCDEMGLGKSLQTLMLLVSNPCPHDWAAKPVPIPARILGSGAAAAGGTAGGSGGAAAAAPPPPAMTALVDTGDGEAIPIPTTLLVTPANLQSQWVEEIQRHLQPGSLKWAIYRGRDDSRSTVSADADGAGANGAAAAAAGDDDPTAMRRASRLARQLANTMNDPPSLAKAGKLLPPALAHDGQGHMVPMHACDVVLVSYEVLRKELTAAGARSSQPLLRLGFWRIVLDEAQLVANSNSVAAEVAGSLYRRHAWVVTGTPISSSLNEVQGLCEFLSYEPYYHGDMWRNLIQQPYTQRGSMGVAAFRALLRGVMLRRSKAAVEDQLALPPCIREEMAVELSGVERAFYDVLKARFMAALSGLRSTSGTSGAGGGGAAGAGTSADGPGGGGGEEQQARGRGRGGRGAFDDSRRPATAHHRATAALVELRQCCCHPQIVRREAQAAAGSRGAGGSAAGGGGAAGAKGTGRLSMRQIMAKMVSEAYASYDQAAANLYGYRLQQAALNDYRGGTAVEAEAGAAGGGAAGAGASGLARAASGTRAAQFFSGLVGTLRSFTSASFNNAAADAHTGADAEGSNGGGASGTSGSGRGIIGGAGGGGAGGGEGGGGNALALPALLTGIQSMIKLVSEPDLLNQAKARGADGAVKWDRTKEAMAYGGVAGGMASVAPHLAAEQARERKRRWMRLELDYLMLRCYIACLQGPYGTLQLLAAQANARSIAVSHRAATAKAERTAGAASYREAARVEAEAHYQAAQREADAAGEQEGEGGGAGAEAAAKSRKKRRAGGGGAAAVEEEEELTAVEKAKKAKDRFTAATRAAADAADSAEAAKTAEQVTAEMAAAADAAAAEAMAAAGADVVAAAEAIQQLNEEISVVRGRLGLEDVDYTLAETELRRSNRQQGELAAVGGVGAAGPSSGAAAAAAAASAAAAAAAADDSDSEDEWQDSSDSDDDARRRSSKGKRRRSRRSVGDPRGRSGSARKKRRANEGAAGGGGGGTAGLLVTLGGTAYQEAIFRSENAVRTFQTVTTRRGRGGGPSADEARLLQGLREKWHELQHLLNQQAELGLAEDVAAQTAAGGSDGSDGAANGAAGSAAAGPSGSNPGGAAAPPALPAQQQELMQQQQLMSRQLQQLLEQQAAVATAGQGKGLGCGAVQGGGAGAPKEEFSCPICLDVCERRTITRCGHTFCTDCIHDIVQDKGTAPCPICRRQLARGELFDSVPDEEAEQDLPPIPTLENAEYGAKVSALLVELARMSDSAPGSKALVFSSWGRLLRLVQEALLANGVRCVSLVGGNPVARQAALQSFLHDPDCRVLLLLKSTSGGAAGLTLTVAHTAFMMEPAVNPGLEAQAAARICRLGQDRPTRVVRIVAQNTVEERVMALQQHKQQLGDATTAAGETATESVDGNMLLRFFDRL